MFRQCIRFLIILYSTQFFERYAIGEVVCKLRCRTDFYCSGLGFSAECAKYSPFTICQNTEIGYRCCQDMCEHEGFSGECQVTTRSDELPVCRKLEYGHDCCEDACEEGMDVSKHNDVQDWIKLRESNRVSFVFVRATFGGYIQDEKFVTNWMEAVKVGIKPMAYHYFIANDNATIQFAKIKQALSTVHFNIQQDILAIDVERGYNEHASAEEVSDKLWNLLILFRQASFANIYIYTNIDYWNKQVAWHLHSFSDFPLWVAKWMTGSDFSTRDKGPSELPNGWNSWAFWQYTSTGTLPGIKGNVDLDRGFCRSPNKQNTTWAEQFI